MIFAHEFNLERGGLLSSRYKNLGAEDARKIFGKCICSKSHLRAQITTGATIRDNRPLSRIDLVPDKAEATNKDPPLREWPDSSQ
jgi:hypothetical protein